MKTLLQHGNTAGFKKSQHTFFTPAFYGTLGMFFMSIGILLMGVVCYMNI